MMQACQARSSLFSLTVVYARDPAKRVKYLGTENVFEGVDEEASYLQLAKEAKEETAELMESPDSVYHFLDDRTVFRCKHTVP